MLALRLVSRCNSYEDLYGATLPALTSTLRWWRMASSHPLL